MSQVLENKNYGVFHANYYCEHLLPLQLISTDNKVEIVFITSPNKTRNTGDLLKHLPHGKSTIPIALNQSIKSVISNETGM